MSNEKKNENYSRNRVGCTSFVSDSLKMFYYAPSKFGFYHAFIASLSVIVVSELGDKTWFIAAILAMRHSRLTVFAGAIGALTVMTVFSACLGWVTQLIPHRITFYLSTALFAIFGLKMLHEAWHMSPSEGQEVQEEAQAEVQKTELDMDSAKYSALETGSESTENQGSSAWKIISFVSTLFVKSFTLTFFAEWGDRSQLTTIVLGAREDVVGVILGGIIGHMICTGIAVVGGRLLAQKISVRTVTLIGGIVFLLFAFSAFFVSTVVSFPCHPQQRSPCSTTRHKRRIHSIKTNNDPGGEEGRRKRLKTFVPCTEKVQRMKGLHNDARQCSTTHRQLDENGTPGAGLGNLCQMPSPVYSSKMPRHSKIGLMTSLPQNHRLFTKGELKNCLGARVASSFTSLFAPLRPIHPILPSSMALTNGVAEGEVELEVQKMDGAEEEEEEEAMLVKKELKLEEGEAEGGVEEETADEAAGDKTEDQVPDITNEDPMTTSMDGIEDIEQKEGEENAETVEKAAEDENTEAAEIPVDVYDEAAEGEKVPEAEQEETPAEEEHPEEEPLPEEGGVELPDTEEEKSKADEALQAESEPEAPEAESETEAPLETPVETEGEEPKTEDEQQQFELQAPPRGRPRTPNDLDELQRVEVEAAEVPSAADDVASVTGSRKAPSVASPVPATPKSAASTKKTTFEDEVLSVKSGRSGRTKSPKSPRSPRTPKSPKSPRKVEIEEPQPEEEDVGAAASKDEEEKQRQESFDARMREREEEEARWKRMTSWDKGEDGTAAVERKTSAVTAETVDEVPEEKFEAEPEQKSEAEPVEEESELEQKVEGEEEPKSVLEEVPVAEAESAPEEAETEEPKAEAVSEEETEAPPGPPRPERSPSPMQRREPSARDRDYMPYDQDTLHETVPARLPTATSFSSYSPAERETYKPISPWVDQSSKYRNEYTVGEPPVAPAAYTAFFDDLVATGPFASSLYSTSRLLERSRSRTRERRQALRSQSQARNYYRFASQYPAPLRTRDYSTPPSSYLTRAPTAASSFVSFIDNYGAKQYDLARSQSLHRKSVYNSNMALSRSVSRGGVDYYLGSGRMSRVESYADALHSRYEWNMPSSHDMYYASNRGQVGYAPLANYQSYVSGLQRSLSREKFQRDKLRNKYATVSYQLDQAVKQMDLLRSHNYSAMRSGSAPRTSVYANFYPYY
uniref:GDT1 family protein n=1 Tax=Globodera rostochiensis TaxID=31243 RepID=A0A914HSD1_GLORO